MSGHGPVAVRTRLDVPASVLLDEQQLRAYRRGEVAGWLRGWQDANAERDAQHRRIAQMVRETARWPQRDVEADERRAQASAAYWRGRRGQGAA